MTTAVVFGNTFAPTSTAAPGGFASSGPFVQRQPCCRDRVCRYCKTPVPVAASDGYYALSVRLGCDLRRHRWWNVDQDTLDVQVAVERGPT